MADLPGLPSVRAFHDPRDCTGRPGSGAGRKVAVGNNRARAPAESGSKLAGWLVRVVAEGKVVAVRGSKIEFEEIARDDAKLAALKEDAAPETHSPGHKR